MQTKKKEKKEVTTRKCCFAHMSGGVETSGLRSVSVCVCVSGTNVASRRCEAEAAGRSQERRKTEYSHVKTDNNGASF